MDIPSYQVKVGDVIALSDSGKKVARITELFGPDAPHISVPQWLSGEVVRLPGREDIDYEVQEHLVVEYYSK